MRARGAASRGRLTRMGSWDTGMPLYCGTCTSRGRATCSCRDYYSYMCANGSTVCYVPDNGGLTTEAYPDLRHCIVAVRELEGTIRLKCLSHLA